VNQPTRRFGSVTKRQLSKLGSSCVRLKSLSLINLAEGSLVILESLRSSQIQTLDLEQSYIAETLASSYLLNILPRFPHLENLYLRGNVLFRAVHVTALEHIKRLELVIPTISDIDQLATAVADHCSLLLSLSFGTFVYTFYLHFPSH
jgi:hypothetical protein